MRQVIRADLDPRSPTRLADARRGRFRAVAAGARGPRRDLNESPGTASLSAAGAGPGLGAGKRKGRGGRSPVCRRRRPRAARRLSAPDPPAAGALRSRLALQSAAASAKILRLNADAARAARPALRRRRRRPGLRQSCCQLWRDLAGRPPSLDPGRLAAAAARARPGRRTRTASQQA